MSSHSQWQRTPDSKLLRATREHITLRLLSEGKSDRQVWEANHNLRIGRLAKCDISLDNTTISRFHAEVLITRQGWALRDLGSTNGTFLNGTGVTRAEVLLKEGDIIQVGEISFLVAAIKEELPVKKESQTVGLEVLDSLNCTWQEILRQAQSSGVEAAVAAVSKLGRKFHSADSLEGFLEHTLWDIAEIFDAQYGAFVLQEEKAQKLDVRAVFSMGDRTRTDPCSYLEIARWALQQDRTMLCRPVPLPGTADAPTGSHPTMILALLRAPERKLGILFLGKSGEQQPFTAKDLFLAETISHCLSETIYSLEKQSSRQRELLIQTLTTLTQLLHLKNSCSREYSDKSAEYALLIAEELSVSEEDRYFLKIGAPLRDLGNIGVPDAILEKPGELTPPELHLLKSHVAKGVALLESIPFLVPLVPMVRSHHERWDGTGYPDGTAGTHIPLLGRIIAVADALDAMTSHRPFRAALSLDEAFAEIEAKAGSQFDPECVQALVRVRSRIEEISWDRRLLPKTYSCDQFRKALTEESLSGVGLQRVRA